VPAAGGRLRGAADFVSAATGGRAGLWDDIVEEAGVGTASSDESRDEAEDWSWKEAVEPSRNFDGILDCEFVEGE